MSHLIALTLQYFIPFRLQESLGSTYFPKEYLFTRKKRLPVVIISWEIMAREQVFLVNEN